MDVITASKYPVSTDKLLSCSSAGLRLNRLERRQWIQYSLSYPVNIIPRTIEPTICIKCLHWNFTTLRKCYYQCGLSLFPNREQREQVPYLLKSSIVSKIFFTYKSPQVWNLLQAVSVQCSQSQKVYCDWISMTALSSKCYYVNISASAWANTF